MPRVSEVVMGLSDKDQVNDSEPFENDWFPADVIAPR